MEESVHDLILQDLERLSSLYALSEQGPPAGPFTAESGATAVAVRLDGLEELEELIDPAQLASLRDAASGMLVTLGQSRGAVEYEGDCGGATVALLFSGHRGAETHAAVALSSVLRMSRAIANVSNYLEEGDLALTAGLDSSPEGSGSQGADAAVKGALEVLAACGVGEIMLTAFCRSRCGDFFSWRQVEPTPGSPSPLYSPLESGTGSVSALDRLLELRWPGMVDRQDELEMLLNAYEESVKGPEGGLSALVWVCGEMGIGKTRLVEELEENLQRRETPPAFIRGRAVHFGNIPYGTWASVLRDVLRREGLSPVRASVPKLLSRLEEKVEVPFLRDGAPYLEAMMGETRAAIPDETSRKTGTGLAVRCLLEALASMPGGLVLFIDNLHWIDRTSMDILEALLDRPPELGRMMVVVTSREPLGPEGEGTVDRRVGVDLGPLSDEMVLEMARGMLGDESLPEVLARYLISSCGGNPFHLQELVYSLVETAVIVPRTSDGCRVADHEFFSDPSPGVQGILVDRIGRQGEDLRRLLQLASVVDERFSARLLARLARDMEMPAPVSPALEALGRAGLIRRRNEETYEFSHSMVREAAYDTILQSGRQRLHGRVAEIMEDIYSENLEDQAASIAHHWAMAGEMDKAIPLAVRAMNGFVERGELEQAEEWLSRVERWLREISGSARFLVDWEVLRCRRRIYGVRSDLVREAEELEKMSVLAEESMNPAWLAEVELQWGVHLHRKGELARARSRIGTALDTARRGGLPELRARSLEALASLERLAGDAALAADLMRRAAEIWEDLGREVDMARATTALAGMSQKLLGSEAAMDLYRQALTLSRESGLKQMEATVLYRMAEFSKQTGKHEIALEKASKGLAICRAIGESYRECEFLRMLGQLYFRRGDYDRAQKALEQALFTVRQKRLTGLEAPILGSMGPLMRARGRVDEAIRVTESALEIVRAQGAALMEAPLLCNIGGLEIERGNLEGARERFGEARELARKSQNYTTEAGVLANLAYLSAVNMEKERALDEYEEALDICGRVSLKGLEVKLRLNRAALMAADGSYESARSDIRIARYAAREDDSPLMEARADREEGRNLFMIGRYDRAMESCSRAMEVFVRLGNDQQRFRTSGEMGRICHALGDLQRAEGHYREIIDGGDGRVPGDVHCMALQGLAEVTRSRGRMDEARDLMRRASYLRETTGAPLSRLEQAIRYGRLLACCGETDRAAQLLQRVDRLNPEAYLRTRLLRMSLEGWVLLGRGDSEGADKVAEEMRSLADGFPGMVSEPEAAVVWLEEEVDANR